MINNSISDGDAASHIYYANARTSLVSLLKNKPGRVLEIGCGTGETLEYLKSIGATIVDGIELRTSVAQVAANKKSIDNIYNINFLIEDLALGEYDTIVLSHVLEHFSDPDYVLKKIRKMLKRDGVLLIAVPNVRHISILIKLALFGNFEYVDSGIMDHTHLKFYTRKSIISKVNECGFSLERSEMDFAGPRSKLVNAVTCGLFEEFVGYAINASFKLSD